MKFAIRDDDLSYFSTPSDIERWYADVFAQGIPVGLSAIPLIKPRGDAHPNPMPQTDDEYAISGNTELTAYVRRSPLIEILQHGTTHETKEGVFEYAGVVSADTALRGREELARAFGPQFKSVFVPPHDWIGVSGVRAVEAAHMDILRGRGAGLRNWMIRPAYVANFIRTFFFKAGFWVSGKTVPAYPYVLDFGKHREVCSYRVEDVDVFDALEYANKKNGIFVVVTHLHFFDAEKKARLLSIIARAKELGAEFVVPSTLFAKQ